MYKPMVMLVCACGRSNYRYWSVVVWWFVLFFCMCKYLIMRQVAIYHVPFLAHPHTANMYSTNKSPMTLHEMNGEMHPQLSIDGYPRKVLGFWRLTITCCAKMEGVLLGKPSTKFSESCKFPTYFSTEFESRVLGRWKMLYTLSMELGVVSHASRQIC